MKYLKIVVGIILLIFLTGCSNNQQKTSDKEYIEETLNLKNNSEQTWTYNNENNSWTLSPVCSVAYPEIEDEEGISVNIPAEYIDGIDTDNNGDVDITSQDYSEPVKGALVINYDNEITSENGQVYTSKTAPIIFNTGAAGYSSQSTREANGNYAKNGYINVETGNRGKQDTLQSGLNTSYTGDAPSSLVDQKASVRFLRYNILLGNLPGNPDYLVSTGDSGGGAHALMLASTSNHPDYYPYEAKVGAVGVYENSDGSYSTNVTIDSKEVEISDGAWGCIAYSPITSLYDADTALAFEYNLNPDYSYNTKYQEELARLLSESYMNYINNLKETAKEADFNIDLDNDGDLDDTVELTIEYDPQKYSSTNGYGGSYITLYQKKFEQSLNNYLNNLDYTEDWTWFDENGNALSDEAVAALTLDDKKSMFISGRYTKSESSDGRPGPDINGQAPPDFNNSDNKQGTPPDIENKNTDGKPSGAPPDMNVGNEPVGTPDQGTTQSNNSSKDSENYSSFEDYLDEFKSDLDEINSGDEFGNNIVDLYNPLKYIKDSQTEKPTWVKVIMGAQEGDISMFNSLNLELALASEGVNTDIEWQWDGSHVPNEILGDSFALTVDQMYGEYVSGAQKISKQAAQPQTQNGDSTSAEGTDISTWLNYNGQASFSIENLMEYRTEKTNKAVPGFDTIDYGQEDYVFGSNSKDARHWDSMLYEVLEENKDKLNSLFNS